jgi:hypothetical protein
LPGSFDGKRSAIRDRRNYPHARGFSRYRRELTNAAVKVINPDEPGCPRLDRCPCWVINGSTYREQTFSALAPIADIAAIARSSTLPKPATARASGWCCSWSGPTSGSPATGSPVIHRSQIHRYSGAHRLSDASSNALLRARTRGPRPHYRLNRGRKPFACRQA